MTKRQPKRTLDREPTEAERKAFTTKKMALLAKAKVDAELTFLEFTLLYHILDKYLWKPGDLAYPGPTLLGLEIGACPRIVKTGLRKLEDRAYLVKVRVGSRGRGPNRANEYQPGNGPDVVEQRLAKQRNSATKGSRDSPLTGESIGSRDSPVKGVGTPYKRESIGSQNAHQHYGSSNNSLEEHTQKGGVCRDGKQKEEKPAPDSSDDAEAGIMELFRGLADKDLPSRYRSPTNGGSPSPDGSPTNGHGPNGHGPTSPDTGDLDHAVAVYLAAHPKGGDTEAVRRELAKALMETPFNVIMAGLNHLRTVEWPDKKWRWIPTPENFLKEKKWKNVPRSVLIVAGENHQPRQEEPPQYDEDAPPLGPVDADDEIAVLETRLRDDPGLSADERDDLRRQLQDMRQGQIAELNQDLGTERVYR
jgi:hypothetical protein